MAGSALLAASCLPTAAYADPLPLETVIALVQSGIGDEAVVAKIRSSGTHIDLSVEQMLDLKSKGVPGPVIAALLETTAPPAPAPKFSMDSPDPNVPHPPGVYMLVEAANKVIRIDPTATNQAKTGGILGYAFTGGLASASVKASIQNTSARVHSQGPKPQFFFFFDESNPQANSGPQTWASGTAATVTSPNEFTLIRLTQKGDHREARVGSMNIAGAKSGVMDKDRIPFEYTMVRPGVFRVQVSAPLASGEYGFIYSLTGGGAGGAITARIFDFSV
ncbi:MAG: hypothetical protein K2X68_10170 [Novosphingobium sp.]|nr:hypothetical protein [Novosphingobium sp.]